MMRKKAGFLIGVALLVTLITVQVQQTTQAAIQMRGGWVVDSFSWNVTQVCTDGYAISMDPGPIDIPNPADILFNPTTYEFTHPVDVHAWFDDSGTIPAPIHSTGVNELYSEYFRRLSQYQSAKPFVSFNESLGYYQGSIPFNRPLSVGTEVAFELGNIDVILPVENCSLHTQNGQLNQTLVGHRFFDSGYSQVEADTLVFTVTELPSSGSIELNETPLGLNDQFTMAEVEGGRVSYVPNNNFPEMSRLRVESQATMRVSLQDDGSQLTGGNSGDPTVDATGRLVAFSTLATDLGLGLTDGNGLSDVYLRRPGRTVLLTPDNADSSDTADGGSFNPRFSPDGLKIMFGSTADNLEQTFGCLGTLDSNNFRDIYIFTQISPTQNSLSRMERDSLFRFDGECDQTGAISKRGTISDSRNYDGGRTVYTTAEPIDEVDYDDSNNADDLVLNSEDESFPIYGVSSPSITLGVSVGASGLDAPNGESDYASISAEGDTVVYQSEASDLLKTFSNQNVDTNTETDIYASDWNGSSWVVSRISVSSTGAQATGGGSFQPAVSQFGAHIVFHSTATNLDPNHAVNGASQVYVRDRNASCTTLLSISPSNEVGNSISYGATVSANGRFVAFQTFSDNLFDGDSNNSLDVLVIDRDADGDGAFYSDVDNCVPGPSKRIIASESSRGELGNGHSYEPEISDNGAFVVFTSAATNLVDGDTNGNEDIFLHYIGQTTEIQFNGAGDLGHGLYIPVVER